MDYNPINHTLWAVLKECGGRSLTWREKTLPKTKERQCKHPTAATHTDPLPNRPLQTPAQQAAPVAREQDLAKEQAGNISLSVFKATQL